MGAIAYDRRGSGPPLVLVHPLGADRHVWDPVLDRLTAERDVVAVDLPGFGASAPLPPGAPPTPAALARAVSELARDLGLDRPHVTGISLGGWVALELALAGEARSVTAIAAAGLWPQPLGPKPAVARAVAHRARALLPAVLATAGGRRLALAGTVGHPEQVPPAAALHLVRAYADSPGFVEVNAAMRAGRFASLERIRVPLTLAWCELDRLVGPPAYLPPTARRVLLRGCGHIPTWDDPALVARVVLEGSAERAVA